MAAAEPLRTENEELFRRLVESVRDYAIFMLDPTGHVATWNVGAERIKGYAAHEIIGRHFSTFYVDDEARSGKCEHELEIAAAEGRFEDEGWRVRKDGTRFWANVVITSVRDRDGRMIGFAKVTRDLTERRRSEEERAARLAAEQANRAKDEFLAMLGHELRNPMAPIVTALQLLKLRGDTRSSREHEIIERQVKHMMQLIDDLLDVARIVRGKVALTRRVIDVRDAVARALEIVSPQIEERRHHLDIRVTPGPLPVDGDTGRLVQTFSNLLTNAARYTEPGGTIAVTLREEGTEVVVEVRDNGIGIATASLPRIFDTFVQGQRADGQPVAGLGLGLSLVRSFVALHGGTVTAHSDGPGAGSTFTVRLPRAEAGFASTAAARSVTPVPQVGVPQRVLLVDDNEDARFVMSEALRAVGHDVRAAGDPTDALEVIAEFTPQIAILDIGLPVMDGYELASRLRDRLGDVAPRLIALTGYGLREDHARSEAAGFAVHLVKPVDMQVLLDAIRTLAR